MLKQHDQVSVCESYIIALEYGDFSGLSDKDIELVQAFIDSMPSGATFEYSTDEAQFCRDAISGWIADCVDVTVWTQS